MLLKTTYTVEEKGILLLACPGTVQGQYFVPPNSMKDITQTGDKKATSLDEVEM